MNVNRWAGWISSAADAIQRRWVLIGNILLSSFHVLFNYAKSISVMPSILFFSSPTPGRNWTANTHAYHHVSDRSKRCRAVSKADRSQFSIWHGHNHRNTAPGMWTHCANFHVNHTNNNNTRSIECHAIVSSSSLIIFAMLLVAQHTKWPEWEWTQQRLFNLAHKTRWIS